MENNCIFCSIIGRASNGYIVFEDDQSIAILDIFPASAGHTLVMPKKHFSLLAEVPVEELTHAIQVVQKVGPAVQHAFNAQGYNVLVNNGTAAGQLVPHLHFHVVPRRSNDGKKFEWERSEGTPADLDDAKERIQKHLSAK